MDPNATLAELREWADWMEKASDPGDIVDRAQRAAELMQALDEWLSIRAAVVPGLDPKHLPLRRGGRGAE